MVEMPLNVLMISHVEWKVETRDAPVWKCWPIR